MLLPPALAGVVVGVTTVVVVGVDVGKVVVGDCLIVGVGVGVAVVVVGAEATLLKIIENVLLSLTFTFISLPRPENVLASFTALINISLSTTISLSRVIPSNSICFPEIIFGLFS